MFIKILVPMMIIGLALTACAPQAQSEPQLLAGGIDAPDLAQTDTGPAVEGSNGEGIDNSGNIAQSEPGSSSPGAEAGSSLDDKVLEDEPGKGAAMEWINYTDSKFGFSLTYPTL